MTTAAKGRRGYGRGHGAEANSSQSRLLTIDDVAEYLGVSQRWVYDQVRRGRLPAMLIARSWRSHQDAVDRFADSFRHDPNSGEPDAPLRDPCRRLSAGVA
jgi:excisionase family DNA binding protein